MPNSISSLLYMFLLFISARIVYKTNKIDIRLHVFLKHDQVRFLCSFQVFIQRINLSRTIDCFRIWRRLLNIVLAEVADNVLIGWVCGIIYIVPGTIYIIPQTSTK